MINKQSQNGVGHSVVEFAGARHVYITAASRSENDLAGQLREALEAVQNVMNQETLPGAIVRQTVFVADPCQIEPCGRQVEAFYGENVPATTYVPQMPCPDRLVAVEAHGLVGPPDLIRVERLSPQLVLAHHNGTTWCHCENVLPKSQNGSLHAGATETFKRMARLLDQAGIGFSQVVRTWLYLGDIVGSEATRQRYQELNRARADFYADIPFSLYGENGSSSNGRFYPASTGIGAIGKGLTISCLALAGHDNGPKVVPLENPNQTSAYTYDVRYGPTSPSFSRAVAVVTGEMITIYISGTASIIGTESCHVGDVQRQTHQTLDNIAALIARSNLARHGIRTDGATLADLAQLRVYLKNPADYETVRRICRDRVGELPTIYSVADVCRPELLVEIEATAFTRAH